jgi:hypothetical protein
MAMQLSTERRDDSPRRPARAASECWVYTRDGGLREVTLANPQSILAVDGQLLRPWCLIDRALLGCAVAIVYSAAAPSRELRDAVTRLARARFESRPWFRKLAGELGVEAGQPS